VTLPGADGQTRADLLTRIRQERLVAIVRLSEPADLVSVARALLAGGINVLELTMTTPGALDALTRCRRDLDDRAIVGAGTVLDAEVARRCLDAGAQFIVSPGIEPEVIQTARAGGALALPGALTPTEILTAWRAGADIVKVFPARTFGPRYIADLRGPFPDIPLMPTGGVDETNAADYLRAGAVGVGVGGRLINAADVQKEDWEAISERARALLGAVRAL
jgi:2-dehydro-3-deoxyphosphogluconate aldolase/(4S)-4-hydroxy-2-oxoglutarate aldolase